jgi:hypothetical protein
VTSVGMPKIVFVVMNDIGPNRVTSCSGMA